MRRPFARVLGLVLAVAMIVGLMSAPAVAKHKKKKTTAGAQLSSATLNGSGSTFQLAFNQVAIGAFRQQQKSVTVNYQGVGSGAGRQAFSDQTVDFAGTDGLFKPEDAAKTKGGAFLYFPTVAGPITVAYNLSGVKSLKLSAETIAKIFMREITTWDDAAIKAENPGVSLPSAAITVARRSDSSGTTENFTKFLKAAAPTTWTLGSGSTVNWPSDTQGGAGNPGVSQIVKSTGGAIGYVDYSDALAAGLPFASVKNSAGKYVVPSLAGASAALAGITVNADLTYDPINAAGATSYPITSPTWIVVYTNQTNAAKGQALKAFLTFIFSKKGQKLAKTVDFAPLPKELLTKAQAQLSQLVIPST